MVNSEPRIIEFSGYDWTIKDSGRKRQAPGPNFYSSKENSVWLDESGYLHLTIGEDRGMWYCSEIFTRKRFGYGTYTVKLRLSVDELDPQMVLGLFTYDHSTRDNHQEIDIEFSRWGNSETLPGHYTIQPHDIPANKFHFDVATGMHDITNIIKWEENIIEFKSFYGPDEPDGENMIQSWCYEGEYIPEPVKPAFRINFWLYQGLNPGNSGEIVVKEFQFTAN